MRRIWFDEISRYNRTDPTRLASEMLNYADVYVGMRSKIEYEACMAKRMFQKVYWVDDIRKAVEPTDRFTLKYNRSMTLIKNHKSLLDLALVATEAAADINEYES